jgi:fructose-6-phosphate aldolase 2
MKLYIDSADIEEIQRLNDYFPITGVTTNPTILVNSKKSYMKVLEEIRNVIGDNKELFVQAIGETAEEIIEESRFITEQLSGKVIVKIPATEEGIKAVKLLSKENIPTLVTTVYTAFQALIAAMAGAKYVAPYVNRIDNLAGDGVNVVTEITKLFNEYKLDCEILAASFKNLQQVYEVCLAGAGSVTVSPDIIEKMIAFPATSKDVNVFKEQWLSAYGKECTTLFDSQSLIMEK